MWFKKQTEILSTCLRKHNTKAQNVALHPLLHSQSTELIKQPKEPLSAFISLKFAQNDKLLNRLKITLLTSHFVTFVLKKQTLFQQIQLGTFYVVLGA